MMCEQQKKYHKKKANMRAYRMPSSECFRQTGHDALGVNSEHNDTRKAQTTNIYSSQAVSEPVSQAISQWTEG